MSDNNLDFIIEKLVSDEMFRAQFETDRAAVIATLTLTEEQAASLSVLQMPGIIEACTELRSLRGAPI